MDNEKHLAQKNTQKVIPRDFCYLEKEVKFVKVVYSTYVCNMYVYSRYERKINFPMTIKSAYKLNNNVHSIKINPKLTTLIFLFIY